MIRQTDRETDRYRLPNARKEKTHCSVAAVCSLLCSGMFSGANLIFMPAVALLGPAWSAETSRCLRLDVSSGLSLSLPVCLSLYLSVSLYLSLSLCVCELC